MGLSRVGSLLEPSLGMLAMVLAKLDGRWPSDWGILKLCCFPSGLGCLSSPSAAHPQREPLALGKKRLFWPFWMELAAEEGNVPRNGRQMFKFQRGRVDFRRKSLAYVYYLMYLREKCYLTHR